MSDNSKALAELRRIQWRQKVMSEGKVAWLNEMAKLHKYRERDIGPNLE